MHTLYYILALLYATLLYADFSLVWLHTPYKAPYVLYGSIRPERAEAPSPGHRPGYKRTQTCRPVRAKAFQVIYKKEELTDEMPQANDIILAGDIKVDRGGFLAERLLRTFYD